MKRRYFRLVEIPCRPRRRELKAAGESIFEVDLDLDRSFISDDVHCEIVGDGLFVAALLEKYITDNLRLTAPDFTDLDLPRFEEAGLGDFTEFAEKTLKAGRLQGVIDLLETEISKLYALPKMKSVTA